MPAKSASPMPGLSRKKNRSGFKPRVGQQALVDWIEGYPDDPLVTAKMPGGYGKSIAIAMAYATKRSRGLCERLLIVTANDTQMEQMRKDFTGDFFRVTGEKIGVWGFANEGNTARASVTGTAEVFVTTIQQVSACYRKSSGINTVANLIMDGRGWMLAADEYHHYASEKDWGVSLQKVADTCKFVVALSATPDRDGNPTIFGPPKVVISYADAIKECAVKRFALESFHYTVDVFVEGEDAPRTYTTDELQHAVRISREKDLNAFEERFHIRYSSKYILPIIATPVERLIVRRGDTGKKLQMLIRAMSCRHAKSVAEQVKSIAANDRLSVDWVGTGPAGRSVQENRDVLRAFVPDKDSSGTRPDPCLDILVQVGMAGEGFDSVNVTEIVDLAIVKLDGVSNQTRQFYLRGSRWIPGVDKAHQTCVVTVSSDHPINGIISSSGHRPGGANERGADDLVGGAGTSDAGMRGGESSITLSGWIDGNYEAEPVVPDEVEAEAGSRDIPPMSPTAMTDILKRREIELTGVSSLSAEFIEDTAAVYNARRSERGLRQLDMSDDDDFEFLRKVMSTAQKKHGQEIDEQQKLGIMRDELDRGVSRLARRIARAKSAGGAIEKSLVGDMCKRVNGRLKGKYGERSALLRAELETAYQDLVLWEQGVINGELPVWAR